VGSVLEGLPRGSRVAVIRLRSLGDCVLTTPALAILKVYRPDLRVSVVVADRFRPIFEDNPDIDDILAPRLGSLRAWRPALCLNLHGGTRSAWMTAFSGARYRAGFGHFRAQWAYNVRIPRAQEILRFERKVHTAEHLASAMFYLGAPVCEVPRARLDKSDTCATRPMAVIHPAASTPEKTWSAGGFVDVARRLQSWGNEVVFIGGPADDLSPFREFRTISGAPLREIKRLLASASFFVGNDSGPAHMAAAYGIPSVVIFGDSDPSIWGPWRTPAAVITEPGGIGGVTPGRVLEALSRLRVPA
jgi:lipopolysaccharide heptosyltransferase III